MNALFPQLPKLPHAPGVYLMRDSSGSIIYIGKARDLSKRVSSYFHSPGSLRLLEVTKTQALVSQIRHVDYVVTASEREALVLERRLILEHLPSFNVMFRDDKSYPYVALTMGEDFPRLFLTRTKKRDGTIYFGPYPSVSGVRQLLKWVWRKRFFQLRPCKLDITAGKPLPYSKVRSCLYLHTEQCPAPCLGKISSNQYGRIARRARWFFEGQKAKMIADWEKEMKGAARQMKYEEASAVRDRIETLRHMNERVTIQQLSPEALKERISQSRGVQELMKALSLDKPPERIECFDISHIQGFERVGSMVQFISGRPVKSEYRKYRIKSFEGIDDFRAMEEVVGRRYHRLLAEKKSLPDLILIDGGKGQLQSAIAALSRVGAPKIQIAALAKEKEEVFLPGLRNSIQLPLDSPASLLLRRVRDEAHRFAISYHRLRRSKQTLLN